jgi:hypothetical protein
MSQRLEGPPSQCVAGDTVTFVVRAFTAGDGTVVSATGAWTCTWRINGVVVATATSATDGSDWVVTLTAAQSAALHPGGSATHTLLFTHASLGRRSIGLPTLTIAPNPEAQTAGQGQPQLERVRQAALDALAAGFEGGGIRQYMIGDEQYLFTSPDDCWKTIRRCDLELSKLRGGSRGMVFAFTR